MISLGEIFSFNFLFKSKIFKMSEETRTVSPIFMFISEKRFSLTYHIGFLNITY